MTLESWDKYTGTNFLKAEYVGSDTTPYTVVNVEKVDDMNQERIRLYLEDSKEMYVFDLNVTNATFCKREGIKNPKALLGKRLCFRKVLVTNPQTKKEVESLRISKIE